MSAELTRYGIYGDTMGDAYHEPASDGAYYLVTEADAEIARLRAELAEAHVALKAIYKADTLLRLRISGHSYGAIIRQFSDWDKHTLALREVEQVLQDAARTQPDHATP